MSNDQMAESGDRMAGSGPPRISAAMCAYGRVVAEPRLSRDGRRLAFLATTAGRGALVVRERRSGGGWGPETVLTSAPSAVPSRAYGGGAFDWLPNGSALVYAAAGGGEQGGGLWLQPARGGPARCIADGLLAAPSVSPDSRAMAYVVDAHHVEVIGLDVMDGMGSTGSTGSTGPTGSAIASDDQGSDDRGSGPVRLSGDVDFCFDPTWSPDGVWVAWHEWDVPAMPWDASRIVVRRADGSGGPRVIAGGEGVEVQQPRFSPDGDWLGFLCDAGEGGRLNLWGCRWPEGDDPVPLVVEANEHGGPSWGQGQRSWAWSPDSASVAYCRNEDGFGSLQIVAIDGDEPGLRRQVSRGLHGGLHWVGDPLEGDRLVAVRSGARTPTCVVGWEGINLPSRETLAVGPVAGFEEADLVEPEVVRWASDDGTSIPGRLYRPRPAGPADPAPDDTAPDGHAPPLIAWVHGGPTDQWGVSFNARIAYWVERGWAVLVPDHRGSTGHGRAFVQALAGRWGELDVTDVAAGLRAAVANGWGDRRRLVVMGGSAGGFTVLNLLASHPGLCAAGVDLYGVADLVDLALTTHRFEAHYLDSLVGPLPEQEDRYRRRSPVNRAGDIVDPLLILQGLDDKVVPPAQSQAIADQLAALGRTVELHLYEGEGHGWGRPETVMDELARVETFLERHVLDASPDVHTG
ncbi:MAG: S9 family peptidase [Acidimicrobiales bacterium]